MDILHRHRWTVRHVALGMALVIAAGCGSSVATPSKPASKPRQGVAQAQAVADEDDRDAVQSAREAPALPRSDERPAPVFRPADNRPKHDDVLLSRLGIRRYESKRLVLYTDIAEEKARALPPLMDQVYEAWVRYFGPLPAARDGSEFQMTGYVIDDQAVFREAGLLPEDLPPFAHGRHRGLQFWMNDQKEDYYREHLLLHEGTHCFMTIVPNPLADATWYMEGMAEYFGTHFVPPQMPGADEATHEPVRFGVMPHDRDAFPGLGRIRMIRDDVSRSDGLEFTAVLSLPTDAFLKTEPYAWSWALCQFLDTHPRYRERFRTIQQHVRRSRYDDDIRALFDRDWLDVQEEWRLFVMNLCHGYDIERAAIVFRDGLRLTPAGASVSVRADRGWQSSGVLVEAGQSYDVAATGRFTLATKPRPWISEPQGVSIRYCEGRPLGQSLACIRSQDPVQESPRTTMVEVFPIGKAARLTPRVTGTLYFRVNEYWNELADNAGEVRATIRLSGP